MMKRLETEREKKNPELQLNERNPTTSDKKGEAAVPELRLRGKQALVQDTFGRSKDFHHWTFPRKAVEINHLWYFDQFFLRFSSSKSSKGSKLRVQVFQSHHIGKREKKEKNL